MPEDAPTQDWYETFFSGLWLDVQRTIKSPEMTSADADRVERALGLSPGAKLLDAPCGQGRIALELAARGYAVTGVDRTSVLLEEARTGAQERGLEIAFVEGDLRDLPQGADSDTQFGAQFDGAFCFWGSFGYFDDVGNVEHARAMARALRPGGRFLIDTHIVETRLPKYRPDRWVRVGDLLLLEERVWDHEAGRMETDWTIVDGGVTETHHSSIRLYTYRELLHVLLAAGFESVEGFSSPNLEPFRVGAARLCAVATMPA